MSSRGRRDVIQSVLAFDRSLDELKAELRQFPWDCDEPLVVLTAEMMTSVLDRFLTAELNAQQLHEWADLIEVREDFDYDPDRKEALIGIVFSLANPILYGPVTEQSVRDFLILLNGFPADGQSIATTRDHPEGR